MGSYLVLFKFWGNWLSWTLGWMNDCFSFYFYITWAWPLSYFFYFFGKHSQMYRIRSRKARLLFFLSGKWKSASPALKILQCWLSLFPMMFQMVKVFYYYHVSFLCNFCKISKNDYPLLSGLVVYSTPS